MLIITGCGRSGTSVLARFCYSMGYNTGGNWSNQVNAGMEDEPVRKLNNKFIAGEIPGDYAHRISSISKLVVKDPRFTFPGVLEYWLATRSDLKFLMLLRKSEYVVSSKGANPEWFKRPETKAQVDHRVVESYRTLARFRAPVETLDFPCFLDQFDDVHKLLTGFGGLTIDKDAGRKCWDALVDKEKVHHR